MSEPGRPRSLVSGDAESARGAGKPSDLTTGRVQPADTPTCWCGMSMIPTWPGTVACPQHWDNTKDAPARRTDA